MNTSDASRAAVNISSETRALYRTASDFADATETTLIAAGGVSPNLLNPDQTEIVLPYDGTVTILSAATRQDFDITMTWTAGSKASALCARLAVEPQDGGVGPMGTDYTIDTTATNCATGQPPVVVATYQR
jgi:hypothetical protein